MRLIFLAGYHNTMHCADYWVTALYEELFDWLEIHSHLQLTRQVIVMYTSSGSDKHAAPYWHITPITY